MAISLEVLGELINPRMLDAELQVIRKLLCVKYKKKRDRNAG